MQNDSSDKIIWELTVLYNKYLKRDPDQPGLDYFLAEIQNGCLDSCIEFDTTQGKCNFSLLRPNGGFLKFL